MKLNCIIVEDEPLALERTRSYVLKVPYINLIAVFDNGMDALMFLKTNAVDLVFLDINMGEFSGIQLLEASDSRAKTIITTAYDEYALKGYDLNVSDYLLKPFTFERFLQAVDKVRASLKENTPHDRKFIFVKTEYRLEKLLLNDVLYIEGMRDYRRIHTVNKRIMTLKTFKEFEEEISPALICRVHKSFMVALDKIDSVERNRIRIGETFLPISETYKKSFFELIEQSAK